MQGFLKIRDILARIVLETTARRLAESRNRAPAAPAGTYGTGSAGWTR